MFFKKNSSHIQQAQTVKQFLNHSQDYMILKRLALKTNNDIMKQIVQAIEQATTFEAILNITKIGDSDLLNACTFSNTSLHNILYLFSFMNYEMNFIYTINQLHQAVMAEISEQFNHHFYLQGS